MSEYKKIEIKIKEDPKCEFIVRISDDEKGNIYDITAKSYNDAAIKALTLFKKQKVW
ncbi:MAG: hypothetical protein WC783_03040 [Candidatus Paceibacterota bacterium]|jgi:hypothetical protein